MTKSKKNNPLSKDELEYLKAKEIVRNYEDRKTNDKEYQIMQENKKLIGNTYKYRNSYGSSDEGWWLYLEIVGVNGTSLVTEEFQHTSHDKTEIKQGERSCYNESGLGYGWMEIPNEEYVKAKNQMLKRMRLRSI